MSERKNKFQQSIDKILEEISHELACEAALIRSNLTGYKKCQIFSKESKKKDFLSIDLLELQQFLSSSKKGISFSEIKKQFPPFSFLSKYDFIKDAELIEILNEEGNQVGQLLLFSTNIKLELSRIKSYLSLLALELEGCHKTSNLSSYENIFKISSDMVVVAGIDGLIKRINPAFRRTLLWSEEDLLKLRVSEIIHPTDLALIIKKIEGLEKKTLNFGINARLKQKNGGYRKIEWVISLDHSNQLVYGIGRDVTKVEETSFELLRAKEMLESTNKVARIGGWEYKVANESLYWTSITKEIHEVTQDYEVDISQGLSFYKEGESLDKISKAFSTALEKGFPFDVEAEITTIKGNDKWVRAIGKPIFVNGECVKVSGTFQDISKEKGNRVALEAINDRMTAVLNASTETCIIATDLDGRITHFNSGSEILLGYTAKEIVGIYTPVIFYDPKELEKQAEENSKDFGFKVKPGLDSLRLKSKLGLPDNGEFTYITRDNERVNVKISVTPIKDKNEEIVGYLSVADDITEKKLWEKKILESEKRYRVFFDNSEVIMYTHDLKGNFTSMNSVGARLVGISEEEMKNKSILDIIPIKSKGSFPYYLKELEEKGKSKGLMQVINHSGREVTWLYNNVVVESAKGFKYVLGSVMDITDRIELERDLNESKKLAEFNAKMKDLFLANMSHEIRTPMNAITGFTRLLGDTKLNFEQEDYLKSINTASTNLLNIINDILDFSKIESGQVNIENVEFNLYDVVSSVERLLRPNAEAKKLRLAIIIDENVPMLIIGDPTRLGQILTNLISNAIKFTENGFVNLEVSLVKDDEESTELKFNVADSGIGIPKDKIQVIFERFTQANTDTTRKYGGTGLGLSISKSLVELQAGTFHVESEVGKGSCFGFMIPFKKVFEVSKETSIAEKTILKHSGLKVLLVEDNILNIKLAMKVLEKQGFIAKVAENGKIAVDILAKESFDVILMDLQMPEMDGYQATQYIRDTLALSTPIIAMTAHSLVGEKEKCLAIGMQDYLPKPFSQEQLYEKIITLSESNTMKENIRAPKPTYDLNYLRTMAEGNKEFEKEIINTSLIHIPDNLKLLLNAIRLLDLKEISAVAHRLKSSFNVMGIDDQNLLKEFELSGITDLSTLENMYFKLDGIYNETRECLELELEEYYA
ncbi:PAS domain S-box protein [uncultured Arcticibacterium sp.]|uniref:PAS domain-containing hybrid sensor histidine kinase/response regulator n=1 Tax=uncultured Arcticibacterium sp. TaxID=2173042 RepID=UPI0030FA559E